MDGWIKIYEKCVICGLRFENTDGVRTCCSNNCWTKCEESEEEEDD